MKGREDKPKEPDIDFLSALGEEYCGIIGAAVGLEVVPQDGYEIFMRAFGTDGLTPERLHSAQASMRDLIMLRDAANSYHECSGISTGHIQDILRRVLWRWPPRTN